MFERLELITADTILSLMAAYRADAETIHRKLNDVTVTVDEQPSRCRVC